MTMFDFTKLSNYSNNPKRLEALRIASMIELEAIKVGTFAGPPGGHGFRRGTWIAEYEGEMFKFFASIPHAATFAQQDARLRHDAALHIGGIRSGYIAKMFD